MLHEAYDSTWQRSERKTSAFFEPTSMIKLEMERMDGTTTFVELPLVSLPPVSGGAQYSINAGTGTTCESGTPIYDEMTCRAAATALGSTFNSVISWTHEPHGCILDPSCYDCGFYLNTHPGRSTQTGGYHMTCQSMAWAAPPPPPPHGCRSDICGDIGNDCCAPGAETRVCLQAGYIVVPGSTSWTACPAHETYQCCPRRGCAVAATALRMHPGSQPVLERRQRLLRVRRKPRHEHRPERLQLLGAGHLPRRLCADARWRLGR